MLDGDPHLKSKSNQTPLCINANPTPSVLATLRAVVGLIQIPAIAIHAPATLIVFLENLDINIFNTKIIDNNKDIVFFIFFICIFPPYN